MNTISVSECNKYGNLNSAIMASYRQPEPVVGMGCTMLHGRDRSPGTVIAVNGKRITVQADKYTRTDNNGMSESQSYAFERDPAGNTTIYRLRKNGQWIEDGQPMRHGYAVSLGERERFYDFSF